MATHVGFIIISILYFTGLQLTTSQNTTIPTPTSSETPSEAPTSNEPTSSKAPTTTLPPDIGTADVSETSFTWTQDSPLTTLTVSVNKPYSIGVTVQKLDLTSYRSVYIKGSDSEIPFATDGIVFSGKLNSEKKYLFKTQEIVAVYNNSVDATEVDSFRIVFEKVMKKGETPTTTVSTTTILLPTTGSPQDGVYYTVNVTGHLFADYIKPELQNAFINCLDTISTLYTDIENVNVSEKFIFVDSIKPCPYNWPMSEKCAQITFRVPIFHDDQVWKGYQINSEHLSLMWWRYSGKCGDFITYDDPETKNTIVWWIVGISLVIIIFVVLLWVIKTGSAKIKAALRKRSRKLSDTRSIISSSSDRILQTDGPYSMEPHYLQDTPKFFEN